MILVEVTMHQKTSLFGLYVFRRGDHFWLVRPP